MASCSYVEQEKCESPDNTQPLQITHAKRFELSEFDEGYILTTFDHITGNSFETILSRSDKTCSNAVKIPAERAIFISSTHIFMTDTLGHMDNVIGFSDPTFSANEQLQYRHKSGQVKMIGNVTDFDPEIIIKMNPDFIMVSGGMGDDNTLTKLESAGITVIRNMDWTEETALGRSEWIKVFGAIFDEYDLATSIHEGIVTNYNSLVSSSKTNQASSFIYQMPYNGVWYVPGQNSFMAGLMNDAGIQYFWPENTESGSISMDFESMLDRQVTDTLWIAPGESTLQAMIDQDERMQHFEAFKLKNVFNADKHVGSNGATFFYEHSALRCDWLLEDIIEITTKGRAASNLHFYRKLE